MPSDHMEEMSVSRPATGVIFPLTGRACPAARGLAALLALGALVALAPGCSLERAQARGVTHLEVAVFEGGYGIEWHKSVARNYEKLHPEVKINLWGDPRVDEKLKPRVLRRSPPDLVSCNLPVWKLIVAGKLYPLDGALDTSAYGLDSPAYGRDESRPYGAAYGRDESRPYRGAYGQKITWRQSLVPGLLAPYQYQGKSYAMPSNLGAWVCWYDQRQFREHGWKPARTWREFTALCEQIKRDGVAPLAFQGKYPVYAWWTLLSLYQRLVPLAQWYEMQDLKPGAFTTPEFIQAAQMTQLLGTQYFENGAMAMTHTESQLEFVNGRAAMCFCGLWLKNEEKNAIPKGFEMRCFAVPQVEGGRGDQRAVYGGGGENFIVPADAKHPKEGLDFLKYMVSLQSAHSYIQQLDTLSPVRDSVKGITISPELQSAVEVLDQSTRIFADRLADLYLDFAKNAMPDALAALVTGKVTPEEFGQRLEAAVEEVRKDPEIYKPPAMGVPK